VGHGTRTPLLLEKSLTPILANSLFVPSHLVPMGAIQDYQTTLKDTDGNDIPIQFWKFNYETNVYTFPRGHVEFRQKHFNHITFEDLRSAPMLSCLSVPTSCGPGLQFTGQLRPQQQAVVNTLLTTDYNGIIDAPPRFGKTITMVYLACQFRMKALFLSPNIDLGRQMLKAFRDFTNIFELEYNVGRKLIDLVEEWDDLKDQDIVIMNYHKFSAGLNGDEALERYANEFGAVFVDEVHKATSPSFSMVVSNFNSKVRLGCTGTVSKKDKSHIINEYIIGPVLAVGEAAQLPCQVRAVKTGARSPFSPKYKKTFWNKTYDYLSHDDSRNLMITTYIKNYAEAGHYCVVTADRVDHINLIVKTLKENGIVAEAYHSKRFKNKKQREQCLEKCRNGEIQVLVAYRTMVLGIDLPRFSAFFLASPTANRPNYYQEFCRVRTPYPGKVMGYIVDFVDGPEILYNCFLARKKEYDKEGFEVIHEAAFVQA